MPCVRKLEIINWYRENGKWYANLGSLAAEFENGITGLEFGGGYNRGFPAVRPLCHQIL